MKNTQVVQFETQALEAERRATLARDRSAARRLRRTAHGGRTLLSALAARLLPLEPGDCEA